MDLSLLGNILIGVALLVYVGYRQTTWRAVDAGSMLRMPLILGVVGVFLMAKSNAPITTFDIAVLAIELALSAGVGAWMGAIAHFRRLDPPRPSRRGGALIHLESRTGWWGLTLWLVVIVVRIGVDVIASRMGAHAVTSTGVILLMFAANRAIRVAVVLSRARRVEPQLRAGVVV